jgi:hypothetical protein
MTRDTEQEVNPCRFVGGYCTHCEATERGDCQGWVSSPKRSWVGLTDEDMKDPQTHIFDFIYGARWAEARLKERNT